MSLGPGQSPMKSILVSSIKGVIILQVEKQLGIGICLGYLWVLLLRREVFILLMVCFTLGLSLPLLGNQNNKFR